MGWDRTSLKFGGDMASRCRFSGLSGSVQSGRHNPPGKTLTSVITWKVGHSTVTVGCECGLTTGVQIVALIPSRILRASKLGARGSTTATSRRYQSCSTPNTATPHPLTAHRTVCRVGIKMSKAKSGVDQIVKLIVGAGQASPSPPVGPALGSKGVKSMDFCKVSDMPEVSAVWGLMLTVV